MRALAFLILLSMTAGCTSQLREAPADVHQLGAPNGADPPPHAITVFGNVSVGAGITSPCLDNATSTSPDCVGAALLSVDGWNARGTDWASALLNVTWSGVSLPTMRIDVEDTETPPMKYYTSECGSGAIAAHPPVAAVLHGTRQLHFTACDGPGETPLVAFRASYALTLSS